MLYTTRHMHQRRQSEMPHKQRIYHVRKSMAAIKLVLSERTQEANIRNKRLQWERSERRALKSIDFEASTVWPEWIPGSGREMPLAAYLTFDVVLRTKDGQKPLEKPPGEAIQLKLTCEDRTFPPEANRGAFKTSKLYLRPQAPSRPSELNYCCHVTLMGDAFHSDEKRFLVEDGVVPDAYVIGGHINAELSAELYGRPLGKGPVPVKLLPSKRLRRRVEMQMLNRELSEKLKERYAMEEDPTLEFEARAVQA